MSAVGGEWTHNVHREGIPWTFGLNSACGLLAVTVVTSSLALWATLSHLYAYPTACFVGVKAPLANSLINWVYDSPPSQSHHIAPRQNTPKSNNKVLRNDAKVPRNRPIAQSSDVRMSAPLGSISRSVWHNSTLSFRSDNCPPVPRNNAPNRQTDAQKIVSPPPKKKRINYKRRERRARERSAIERAERGEMFNHNPRWATQSSGAPPSPIVPDQLTESGLLHSDPIPAMRPAVYPPVTLEGRPSANENSSFQFDQELGESAGLYKPAVPDPQQLISCLSDPTECTATPALSCPNS